MSLVAGVDSSTQSCKVVVCDAATGEVLRSGRSGHAIRGDAMIDEGDRPSGPG